VVIVICYRVVWRQLIDKLVILSDRIRTPPTNDRDRLANANLLILSINDWVSVSKMWLGKKPALLALTTVGFVAGQNQKPLTDETIFHPSFTVRQQSSDLCDAGSRQWTGTVNVTAEKSMFFCTCAIVDRTF
jgi:hypothetical protein